MTSNGVGFSLAFLRNLEAASSAVVYCNPEDAERPIVRALVADGYRLVSRFTIPRGTGFFQNAADCGVLLFTKGIASIGENVLPKLFFGEPIRVVANP